LDTERIITPLIVWFRNNARDLPWRRTSDPYAIWVSEIMLQQTQVKTVVPFYLRWMKRFPDVKSLARANHDDVLKHWAGLGYYSRASNLHRAAILIAERFSGSIPTQFEEVLALPGIGRYTAGAICSIAYNQPVPIVDGNVVRVLARVFGIRGNARLPATQRKFWRISERIVNAASRCGSPESHCFRQANESLMELGATICLPRNPRCEACPIKRGCASSGRADVERLPNLGPRKTITRRHFLAFAIRHQQRWLVQRRPDGVVNGLLWEFPSLEVTGADADAKHSSFACLGFKTSSLKKLCTIRHSITRYRIQLDVFVSELPRPVLKPGAHWLSLLEIAELPMSSAHRKLATSLVVNHSSNLRRKSETKRP
jgi:A/G-specific adenine glycosylase